MVSYFEKLDAIRRRLDSLDTSSSLGVPGGDSDQSRTILLEAVRVVEISHDWLDLTRSSYRRTPSGSSDDQPRMVNQDLTLAGRVLLSALTDLLSQNRLFAVKIDELYGVCTLTQAASREKTRQPQFESHRDGFTRDEALPDKNRRRSPIRDKKNKESGLSDQKHSGKKPDGAAPTRMEGV